MTDEKSGGHLEVSVVIPTYNVGKYLDRTIQSVLMQASVTVEVIVLDDGSTDNTVSVAKGWLENDQRVRFYQLHHSGVSHARNEGIKLAKYDYIQFVDGDDFLAEDFYLNINPWFKGHPDIVGFNLKAVSDYTSSSTVLTSREESYGNFENQIWSGDGYGALKLLFEEGIRYQPGTYIFSRDLFFTNDTFFPEDIEYGEDYATVYLLLANANKIFITDVVGYMYVQRSSSATHIPKIKYSYDLMETSKKIMIYVSEKTPTLINLAAKYTIPRLLTAYQIASVSGKKYINLTTTIKNQIFQIAKQGRVLTLHGLPKENLQLLLLRVGLLAPVFRWKFKRRN